MEMGKSNIYTALDTRFRAPGEAGRVRDARYKDRGALARLRGVYRGEASIMRLCSMPACPKDGGRAAADKPAAHFPWKGNFLAPRRDRFLQQHGSSRALSGGVFRGSLVFIML